METSVQRVGQNGQRCHQRQNSALNALAPSWFPTEIITDPCLGRVHDEQRAWMELFTTMGRLERDEELLGTIIFLVSLAALYVTGAILHVDGGYRAW